MSEEGAGPNVGLLLGSPAALVLLLSCTLFCCCCGGMYLLINGTGTLAKHELVWPAGVTPLAGGGGEGFMVLAGGEGDPGYATYRSVGWEITSPYGWRTLLGEDLLPIPGEYEFHDGIDLAGPGIEYHDPLYAPIDGQPFYVGFYGDPPYYGGAGEAVILWNVHSSEETPVRILLGHLEAYQVEVETYCLESREYVADIPIRVLCAGDVVPEEGSPGDCTGPDGKAKFYNGTPGTCIADVFWPADYEPDGRTSVMFDQRIDEERGVARDALVRFFGCKVEVTPTPTPTATRTLSPGALASSAESPVPSPRAPAPGSGQALGLARSEVEGAGEGAGGSGGSAPRGASATPTRLPSPTPAPSPTPTVPGAPTQTPVVLPSATPAAIPSATPAPSPPPGPTATAGPSPTSLPTRLPSPTPSSTPTRLASPTPAGTPGAPTATPAATPWPTWPPGPTSTPWPTWPPGPTRTPGPTRATATPLPTQTSAPRPTPAPRDCPIGDNQDNLCYFDGFGPPITLDSQVKQGQTILGYIGVTGRTTGPHLHLALSIWGLAQVDVLSYYHPVENGVPVPDDRLHYYARYPEWVDPLQFLPQANAEMGAAFMDQPLQLPPGQIIPEAGEGTWHSPADVYSSGGGGRVQGFDLNRLICGWFGWLCQQ